jgi:hypothetical protein
MTDYEKESKLYDTAHILCCLPTWRRETIADALNGCQATKQPSDQPLRSGSFRAFIQVLWLL